MRVYPALLKTLKYHSGLLDSDGTLRLSQLSEGIFQVRGVVDAEFAGGACRGNEISQGGLVSG